MAAIRRMFSLPGTGSLVTLSDGEAELVVAPDCGARLCAYRVGGRDMLRPASDEALASAFPYGFAAFPLLPYSGPIFGDGFTYRGQFHPLARNVPAEPSATHGEGWIRPWQVLDRSGERNPAPARLQPGAEQAVPLRLAGRDHLCPRRRAADGARCR